MISMDHRFSISIYRYHQLHPNEQANQRMQAQLEEMQKEVDKNKRKTATTPTPKHAAPSPASSSSTPFNAKAKGKPSVPQQDSNSEGEADLSQLSYGAKLGRLRRLCERKNSGKLKVPQEVHDRWNQKGQARDELLAEFEQCNFDKDSGSALHGLIFQDGTILGNTHVIHSDPSPHTIYHILARTLHMFSSDDLSLDRLRSSSR